MNREDIIKKSQIENKGKDEREKFIDGRAEVYATIITSITLIVLIISSVIRKTDLLGLLTVLFAGVMGEFIGKAKHNRNFNNISSVVIFGILFVYCLIKFLIGNSFVIEFNL